MKLPRRQFLQLAAGAAALPSVSGATWAQAYPTRPVRIIVGYPPGGVPYRGAAPAPGQFVDSGHDRQRECQ
jgi:hypothetical protein